MTSDSLDRYAPVPVEVLSAIFQHLDRRDIAVCIRVNSVFYSTAIPHMYKTVALTSRCCIEGPGYDVRRDKSSFTQSTRRPMYRRAWLATHTQRLELKGHNNASCKAYVTTTPLRARPSILVDHWGTSVPEHKECAFVNSLRPHTLVHRGTSFVEPRTAIPPRALKTSVRQYTIIVEKPRVNFTSEATYWDKSSAYPAAAESVTIVLYQLPRKIATMFLDPIRMRGQLLTRLVSVLLHLLRPGGCPDIILVDAEFLVGADHPMTLKEQLVAAVENRTAQMRLDDPQRVEDIAQEAARRLTCLSKEQYASSGQWRDALTAKEVAEWLR